MVGIRVTKITVLSDPYGPYTLYLELALPCATYPYTGPAFAKMTVATGNGAEYVRKHFAGVNVSFVSSNTLDRAPKL